MNENENETSIKYFSGWFIQFLKLTKGILF